jgi:hypothetical protein
MGVMSRFLLKIARQAFSVLSLCGLGVQFKVGADGVRGLAVLAHVSQT